MLCEPCVNLGKPNALMDGPARMLTFYSPRHHHHAPPVEALHSRMVPYLEQPQRIENIRSALTEQDLAVFVEMAENVSPAELAPIHDLQMIAYLQQMSEQAAEAVRQEYALYHLNMEEGEAAYFYPHLFPLSHMTFQPFAGQRRFYVFDNTAPFGTGTWNAVSASAALAKAGADALLSGQVRQAYALCRPPGHHAGRDYMGGYCYVNNAALAASRLLALGKVAVLDIDYHHGNGTQHIFWDDPRVLVLSIHADPVNEYPFYAGSAGETGGSAAHGATINYPLPMGVSAGDYLETFGNALNNLRAFGPAALVVSLGFDTYIADAMGTFRLDIPEYEAIARQISALELPTLYIQEGGYNVNALGNLACAFVRGALTK